MALIAVITRARGVVGQRRRAVLVLVRSVYVQQARLARRDRVGDVVGGLRVLARRQRDVDGVVLALACGGAGDVVSGDRRQRRHTDARERGDREDGGEAEARRTGGLLGEGSGRAAHTPDRADGASACHATPRRVHALTVALARETRAG
jgi:hypothetical protein